MFFILSKILSFLLQPITWVFILLLLSLFSKGHSRKRYLVFATVIFFLFSNKFLYQSIARAYSSPPTEFTLKDQKFKYAIVLGGLGSKDKESGQFNFEMTADRITAVLPLYFNDQVEKIILSGGSGRILKGEKESVVLKDYLLSLGIASQDILIESRSRNTYENAKYTAEVLANLPKGKILLSTSCLHMPRAAACFQKQGIDFTPYAVDPIPMSNSMSIDQYLIPSSQALNDWYHLIHEWTGYLIYKLKAYC